MGRVLKSKVTVGMDDPDPQMKRQGQLGEMKKDETGMKCFG